MESEKAIAPAQGRNDERPYFVRRGDHLPWFHRACYRRLSRNPEDRPDRAAIKDFAAVERGWVQSLCAFQLVTIDLLVLSVLLFLLAATDHIAPKRPVALGISAYFALWGGVWLLQLFLLGRRARDFLFLIQWLLFFSCAGLVYWGTQSL